MGMLRGIAMFRGIAKRVARKAARKDFDKFTRFIAVAGPRERGAIFANAGTARMWVEGSGGKVSSDD